MKSWAQGPFTHLRGRDGVSDPGYRDPSPTSEAVMVSGPEHRDPSPTSKAVMVLGPWRWPGPGLAVVSFGESISGETV